MNNFVKKIISSKNFISIVFIIGLAVKIALLFAGHSLDINTYIDWGNSTLANGLGAAFGGNYFPIQYQLFSLYSYLAKIFHLNYFFVYKLANLYFDVGIFVLLIAILKTINVNPLYSLIYWIHPWFLVIFSQGYVDFQFSFFVMLSITILLHSNNNHSFNKYIYAGIPMAIAFLMKPQAEIIILTFFIFGLLYFIENKSDKWIYFLLPTGYLFMAYFIFIGLSQSFLALAKIYLNTLNLMPCLTANMLNIWYWPAYLLKQAAEPIYMVSDKVLIFSGFSARTLAIIITLGLIITLVYFLNKNKMISEEVKYIYLFSIPNVITPFLMTSAHENHLFLGTQRERPFRLSVHVLLLIQFINVYLRYIQPSLIPGVDPFLILSLISMPFFFIIIWYFFKTFSSKYKIIN